MKKFKPLLVLAFLLVGPLQAPGQTEVDITSPNLDFHELDCDIMELDPVASIVVACERTVRLIDLRQGNRRLKTLLSNSQGKPVSLSAFTRGERVFVRGFLQEDGTIHAREIHQLPSGSRAESWPSRKKIPAWSWQTAP